MSRAKAEPKQLPKKFYQRAALDPVNGGFVIQLDGKNVRTPQQKMLHCPSQQLAQKIVQEWNAQTDVINTDTMPLTRLLNIALDRVQQDRAALLADIANYCETDLLFYREPPTKSEDGFDSPSGGELAALQLQHFTPVLEWVQQTYAAAFHLTEGLMPVAQPDASLAMLRELFAAANDHELAALAMMVPLLGSALLVLAVWKGQLDVEAALIAARLDEAVQAKHWGEDLSVAAKWETKARDVRACAFFLTCK